MLLSAVDRIGEVAEGARRGRPVRRDAGRHDPGGHHHRADHARLDAGRHRRRRGRRRHDVAGHHRRRRGRHDARGAVVVRDEAAVRLARARAAHQGAVGRPRRPPAVLRRRLRGGPDDLGRAAAQPAADRQGRPRSRRGPLRVGRVHQRQRRQGRAREVRGVRARRPRVLGPEDRRRRREDRRGHRHLGHPAPTWSRAASSPPAGCWRTGRPTTTCSTRSTGSSCRGPTSPPRPSWPA